MSNIEKHLDVAMLNELKEIMENDFLSLLETYLSDSDQRIKALSVLLETTNFEEIGQSAHSLKGSSSNIGAHVLTNYFKQIEEAVSSNQTGELTVFFTQAAEEYQHVKKHLLSLC